ncbi:bifunctional 3'-5' exonuclease/DNA polymerase [Actinoalloteichus hymeniacidonis]|uniref:DNA-directed DNA polymerase n=1 Tax=Actinoalloteichus hymeniacidonis TaxID=340345 RepID=A0AAC9HP92_9PSEU|nr:bifunctional 3'-5' exonuclease/DNA polymerase [Actinoalloteichus hymeniacidonis]AOS63019.1 DNA polymerase I family protein with 3'-5'-exonuclease and polymerase domains [Actinoalloteichus hymeniacidonis]MBB5908946.1 DNA polymerase-1 [Actinoalloteichus hymeniacidonis]
MFTAVAGSDDRGSDGRGGALVRLDHNGAAREPVRFVADLAAAIAEEETAERPRWVLADAARTARRLAEAGVRIRRCHDLRMTEALLLGHAGRWGEPAALAASVARLRGLAVPEDSTVSDHGLVPALFEPEPPPLPGGGREIDAVLAVHADQRRRIAQTGQPGRFNLLVAAESAGALVAEEMGRLGLPWRADIHHELLVGLLGPRPPAGVAPRRLGELASAIADALQAPRLHPDSPQEIIRAFAQVGVRLTSTRSWVLREVDHPAVPLLLEYKELSRLHSAHGWSWLSEWVHDGRFRPQYVPGAVVSGRWASRGGGALQIPKTIRRAVVAMPGWTLVVADACQLEPRVLAAISEDPRLAAASHDADLYRTTAAEAFDGDRERAKIGVLAALYGQTSGEAGTLVAALRRRFPVAVDYVEHAARQGEAGALVRSRLGRTCPPSTLDADRAAESSDDPASMRAGWARGRFTRNFVVQASAADWAATLVALLRTALFERADAELVFFQHDEVMVHCRKEVAEELVETIHHAASEASRLVFEGSPVRFPMDIAVVDCYADAKQPRTP